MRQTWDSWYVGITGKKEMSAEGRRTTKDQIDEFLNAWLAENPKK